MGWPTPQDYNEAIQNPQHCFFDNELKSGVVKLNSFGIPASITGSFASVYSVSTEKCRYAVRCLLHDIPDQKMRYERLSKAICSDSLVYTTDFEYQKEGIKVGGKTFPIVKMLWLSGENLDVYIDKNYSKQKKMKALRKEFLAMSRALMNEGFAHGDLQHGNIIMTKDGIRLVDYDGMFVPSLTGLHSNELGHRNYQHPGREKQHFGPYLDNFSAWVIDTTLVCLENDPTIYEKWHSGNEALLFEQKDYINPKESALFAALEMHDSEEIRMASRRLRTIINCLFSNAPGLFDEVPMADELESVLKKRKEAELIAEWKAAEEMAQKQQRIEKEAQKSLQSEQEKLRDELKTIEHSKPDWLNDTDNVNALHLDFAKSSNTSKPVIPGVSAGNGVQNLNALTKEFYQTEILSSTNLEREFPNVIIEKDESLVKDYGTNNAVFHIVHETEEYALKFFGADVESMEKRYRALSNFMDSAAESLSTVLLKPEIHENLIAFNGTKLPGVKTPWLLETLRMDEYIRQYRADFDYSLLTSFRRAMKVLRSNRIAHGSLDPSNIMVGPEFKITFVDYDNIYFDSTCAFADRNKGDADYEHPRFNAAEFDLSADNFPAWVIDTMLMCWSADRRMWKEQMDSRGKLFFSATDFTDPNSSVLIQTLLRHQVYEFTQRAKLLLSFLKLPSKDVPPLTVDGFPPPGFA